MAHFGKRHYEKLPLQEPPTDPEPGTRRENNKRTYFIVEHTNGARIYVNANCNLKIIYEYVRLHAGIPEGMEYDLVDDGGNPVSLYAAPEGASGTELFEHKKIYYIILLERNKRGKGMCNPRIVLNKNHPDFLRLQMEALKRFPISEEQNEKEPKKDKSSKKGDLRKHHKPIF